MKGYWEMMAAGVERIHFLQRGGLREAPVDSPRPLHVQAGLRGWGTGGHGPQEGRWGGGGGAGGREWERKLNQNTL